MPQLLFDSERARIAGIKSGEARRNKPVKFPLTVQAQPLITEPDLARTVSERLKLIAEQIRVTRECLNKTSLPCGVCGQTGLSMPEHHRAALLRALDSLIERECDLLGIPSRGRRMDKASTAKPKPALPEPVDPS